VKLQREGEYHGNISRSQWNGIGSVVFKDSGDFYKGNFKDGKRNGYGLCQFPSGAIYKGDWKDDLLNGIGTLYSGNGEILESKFVNGCVISDEIGTRNAVNSNSGRIKIMFTDGTYYDGMWANHKRHG